MELSLIWIARRRFGTLSNLLLVYVSLGVVDSRAAYAITFPQAEEIARAMGCTETRLWRRWEQQSARDTGRDVQPQAGGVSTVQTNKWSRLERPNDYYDRSQRSGRTNTFTNPAVAIFSSSEHRRVTTVDQTLIRGLGPHDNNSSEGCLALFTGILRPSIIGRGFLLVGSRCPDSGLTIGYVKRLSPRG
jgi:hypothetical protein